MTPVYLKISDGYLSRYSADRELLEEGFWRWVHADGREEIVQESALPIGTLERVEKAKDLGERL